MSETDHRSARCTALAVDVGVVVTLCLQLRTRAARQAPGSRVVFVLVSLALQRGILQMILRVGELLAVSSLVMHLCGQS
jgi:hypothetical protein